MLALLFGLNAHIVAIPDVGEPGGYVAPVFRIGHACSESETTKSVEFEIPESVYMVRAKYTAGWTSNVTTEKLDTPIDAGESKITSKTTKVTFTSTEGLANDMYQELGLSFQLPKTGNVVFFKTTQICSGNTTKWVNIPENNDISKWDETPKPAPYVQIKETASASSQDNIVQSDQMSAAMGVGIAGLVIALLALAISSVVGLKSRKKMMR